MLHVVYEEEEQTKWDYAGSSWISLFSRHAAADAIVVRVRTSFSYSYLLGLRIQPKSGTVRNPLLLTKLGKIFLEQEIKMKIKQEKALQNKKYAIS